MRQQKMGDLEKGKGSGGKKGQKERARKRGKAFNSQ